MTIKKIAQDIIVAVLLGHILGNVGQRLLGFATAKLCVCQSVLTDQPHPFPPKKQSRKYHSGRRKDATASSVDIIVHCRVYMVCVSPGLSLRSRSSAIQVHIVSHNHIADFCLADLGHFGSVDLDQRR